MRLPMSTATTSKKLSVAGRSFEPACSAATTTATTFAINSNTRFIFVYQLYTCQLKLNLIEWCSDTYLAIQGIYNINYIYIYFFFNNKKGPSPSGSGVIMNPAFLFFSGNTSTLCLVMDVVGVVGCNFMISSLDASASVTFIT